MGPLIFEQQGIHLCRGFALYTWDIAPRVTCEPVERHAPEDHGVRDLFFEDALMQLLNGTCLTYRYLAENAITIVPISLVDFPPSKARRPIALYLSPNEEKEAAAKACRRE